ncbi:MAG: tetratricopeptide repeat protein [Spirochaetota bacterium]
MHTNRPDEFGESNLPLLLWELQESKARIRFLDYLPSLISLLENSQSVKSHIAIFECLSFFREELLFSQNLQKILTQLLTHRKYKIRFLAGNLLAYLYHEQMELPLLYSFLFHPDPHVRKGVFSYLHKASRENKNLSKDLIAKVKICLQEKTKYSKEYATVILTNQYINEKNYAALQELLQEEPKVRVGRFLLFELGYRSKKEAELLLPFKENLLHSLTQPEFSPFVLENLTMLIRAKEEYASEVEFYLKQSPGENPKDTAQLLVMCREMHLEPPLREMEWYRKADAERKSGHYKQAVQFYQNVLYINPENYGSWNNLGICYYYLGEEEKAVEALQKCETFYKKS